MKHLYSAFNLIFLEKIAFFFLVKKNMANIIGTPKEYMEFKK